MALGRDQPHACQPDGSRLVCRRAVSGAAPEGRATETDARRQRGSPSPAPVVSDGKTVTSINLAGALARGSGTRVLLIDADLRRPAVETHLGLHGPTGAGLADALRDERIGLRQIVRAVNHGSSVSVVLAGSSRIHVPELLRSPRFESLLQEARALYDFVVLDTPPLAPVYDAAVLSRLVDGLLIVVAAHETPRKLLEETIEPGGRVQSPWHRVQRRRLITVRTIRGVLQSPRAVFALA